MTGKNEGAGTILAHVKAVKFWTYFSFSIWHQASPGEHLGPLQDKLNVLSLNCKAILKVEKPNTFAVNTSIQKGFENSFIDEGLEGARVRATTSETSKLWLIILYSYT